MRLDRRRVERWDHRIEVGHRVPLLAVLGHIVVVVDTVLMEAHTVSPVVVESHY